MLQFENIMLSERSQTPKVTCYIIPLTGFIQNKQIHRNRKQISGCQGWTEGGMWNDCLVDAGFPFGVMEMSQN